MERQCHQVPRLPRKVARRSGRLKRAQARHQSQPSAISATPATQSEGRFYVEITKCHACHANGTSMSPSATPATQMERQCHQVPRLPRKVARRSGRLKRAQARHQSQPSAISATPATQSEGVCRQVPRLPSAPPEPAQCHRYHACHANWTKVDVAKIVCECETWCVKHGVCQRGCVTKLCVKDGVWQR